MLDDWEKQSLASYVASELERTPIAERDARLQSLSEEIIHKYGESGFNQISVLSRIYSARGRTPERPEEYVFLIHGIRTRANWQPMVKRVLEQIQNVTVIPIKFGFYDALRFWFPFGTRKFVIDDVRRQIQNGRHDRLHARFSVIAHSFGTYAISKILLDNPDFTFHRLILCGCIIPRNYRWEHVRERLKTGVINDCGSRDVYPILAKMLSWGYGDTGRNGFGRGSTVRDRLHDFSHSEFFQESFVAAFWKPWFDKALFVTSAWDEQAPSTPWLLEVLACIPVKTISFVAIALFLFWWFK